LGQRWSYLKNSGFSFLAGHAICILCDVIREKDLHTLINKPIKKAWHHTDDAIREKQGAYV